MNFKDFSFLQQLIVIYMYTNFVNEDFFLKIYSQLFCKDLKWIRFLKGHTTQKFPDKTIVMA